MPTGDDIAHERKLERENAVLALLDELRYTNRILVALLVHQRLGDESLCIGRVKNEAFVKQVTREALQIEAERREVRKGGGTHEG